MRKRTAMLARLKRLEQRQLGQAPRRRIILNICDREESEIVGYSTMGGVTVLRLGPDEKLAEFEARSFSITGSFELSAVYSDHAAAAERDYAAEWHNPALKA